jgi:hypothetical protein
MPFTSEMDVVNGLFLHNRLHPVFWPLRLWPVLFHTPAPVTGELHSEVNEPAPKAWKVIGVRTLYPELY